MKLFSEEGQKNLDTLRGRMFDTARTRIEERAAELAGSSLTSSGPGGALPTPESTWKPVQLRAQDVMAKSGDFEAMDTARTLGTGTVSIAQGLASLLELTGAVDAGKLTQPLEQYVAGVVQNMSPSAQEALQRKWASLDQESVWRNPKSALLQLTQQLPQLAVSFGSAGLGIKGARALAGAKASKEALVKAGTAGAALAGGATEGVLTAGDAANTVIGEIMKLDATREQKQALVDAVHESGDIAQIGIVAAAVGLAPGYVYGRILQGRPLPFAGLGGAADATLKQKLAGRAARATATGIPEAGQETLQEGYQAYKENVIAGQHYDPTRDPMANVGERMVAGAGLGFGMGAIPGSFVPPDVHAALKAKAGQQQNPPADGSGSPDYIPPDAFARPQGEPQWSEPPVAGRPSTTTPPPLRQRGERNPQQRDLFGIPSESTQGGMPMATGAGRQRGGYATSLLEELRVIRGVGPGNATQRRAAQARVTQILGELERLGVDPNTPLDAPAVEEASPQMDLFKDQQAPGPLPTYEDANGQQDMFPPAPPAPPGGGTPTQQSLFPWMNAGDMEDRERRAGDQWGVPRGQGSLDFNAMMPSETPIVRAETEEDLYAALQQVTRSAFAPYVVFNGKSLNTDGAAGQRLQAFIENTPAIGELLVEQDPETKDTIVANDPAFVKAFQQGTLPEATHAFARRFERLRKGKVENDFAAARPPLPSMPTEQPSLSFDSTEQTRRRLTTLKSIIAQLEAMPDPTGATSKRLADLRPQLEAIEATVAARGTDQQVEQVPSDDTYQKDFGVWDETSKYQPTKSADVNPQHKLAVFQGREQPWNGPAPVAKPREPLTRAAENRPLEEAVRRYLPFTTYGGISAPAARALYRRIKGRREAARPAEEMSAEDKALVRQFLNPPQGGPRVSEAQVLKVLGFDSPWELQRATAEAQIKRIEQEGTSSRKARGVLDTLQSLISEMEQGGQSTVPDLDAVAREVDRIQGETKKRKTRLKRMKALAAQPVPTRTDTNRMTQQGLPLDSSKSEAHARRRAAEVDTKASPVLYTARDGRKVTAEAMLTRLWQRLQALYAGNQITEEEAGNLVEDLITLTNTAQAQKAAYTGNSPYAQNLQEAKDWLSVYASNEGVDATDVLREIDALFQTDTGSLLALAPNAGGLANLIAQLQTQRTEASMRRAEEAKAAAMAELRLALGENRSKAAQALKRKVKQLDLFPVARARAPKSLKKAAPQPSPNVAKVQKQQQEARIRQMKAELAQKRKIEQGLYDRPAKQRGVIDIPLRKMLTEDVQGVFESAQKEGLAQGLSAEEAAQYAVKFVRKRMQLSAKKAKLVERVARGELGWSDVLRDMYLKRIAGAAVATKLDIPQNRAEALVQEHQEYIAAKAQNKKDLKESTLSADPALAAIVNDIIAGQLAKAIAAQSSQVVAGENAMTATEDTALAEVRGQRRMLAEDEQEEDTRDEDSRETADETEESEEGYDAEREEALSEEEASRAKKDLRTRKPRGKGRGKKQVTEKPPAPAKPEGKKEPEAGGAVAVTEAGTVQVGPSRARPVRAGGEQVSARRLRGAIYLTQIAADTPRVVSEADFVGAAADEVPFEHQFDGANMILHRINTHPKGSVTLLADTAGMGKTGTMMLVALERAKQGPVLVVVNNLQGGVSPFARDIKRLGANTNNLYFTSYTAIRDGDPVRQLVPESLDQKVPKFVRAAMPDGGFDTLIADEAHAVKKEEVKTSAALRNVKTKHKLFATATPADKYDSLAVLAEVEGLSLEDFLNKIGLSVTGKYQDGSLSVETMPGLTEEDVHLRLAQRLSKLMDSYGFIRRDYELWATQETRYVNEIDVADTAQGKHLLSLERRLRNAHSTLQQTNDQNTATAHSAYVAEAMKVAATLRTVKEELAEGRSVVVLGLKYDEAAQSSPTAGKLGILGETIPSGLLSLKAALEAEGIRVATYWGAGGTNTNEQQRVDFQNDKVHVLLGQFQKAGQSVDLDAQKDDSRPRTLVLMAPPWSFSERQQAVRRVARAGTTSEARVIDIVAPFTLGDQQRMQKLAVKEDLGVTIEDPAGAVAREGRSDRGFEEVVKATGSGEFVTVRFLTADRRLLGALGRNLKDLQNTDARTENNKKIAQFSGTSNSWKIDATAWPTVLAQLQHTFNAHRGPITPAPVQEQAQQETPPAPPVQPAPKRSLKGRSKKAAPAPATPATSGFTAVENAAFTATPDNSLGFDSALVITPKKRKDIGAFVIGQMGAQTVIAIPNAQEESADYFSLDSVPPAYADIVQDVLAAQAKEITNELRAEEQTEKAALKAWGNMPQELYQRLSTGKVITAREAVEIIERGMPKWNILGRRLIRRLRLTLAPDTMVVYDPNARASQFSPSRNVITIKGFDGTRYIGSKPVYHVLHEVIHAVTEQAILTDAAFRNEGMRLLQVTRAALADKGPPPSNSMLEYALTSLSEFMAVALTDFTTARVLDSIVDPMAPKMGRVRRTILGAIRDAWLTFLNHIYQGPNKSYAGRYRKGRGLRAGDYVSVFESLLVTVNQNARGYDSSVPHSNALHAEVLMETGHGSLSYEELRQHRDYFRRAELSAKLEDEYAGMDQNDLPLYYNPMAEAQQLANKDTLKSIGRTIYGKVLKHGVLPLMNVAQIEATYGRRFSAAEGETPAGTNNYLSAYSQAIAQKDTYVQRYQGIASKVHRALTAMYDKVDKELAERVSKHYMDATIYQIWPDSPFNNPDGPNHSLMYLRSKDENKQWERRSDEEIADAKEHYDRLHAEHVALNQLTNSEAGKMFALLTKHNADEWDSTTFQLMRNTLQAFKFRWTDSEGHVFDAPTDVQKEAIARDLLQKRDIAEVGRFDAIGRDGETADKETTEALNEALEQIIARYYQRKQGPYIAAKRHGDTVLEATRNPKTVTVGNTDILLPELVASVVDKMERTLGDRTLWGEQGEATYRALLSDEIRKALKRQLRAKSSGVQRRDKTLRFDQPKVVVDEANLESGNHVGTRDYSEYTFQLFENDGPALETAEELRKEGWTANVGSKADYFSTGDVQGSTLHAKILARLPVDDAPLRNAITAAMIELMAETSIKKAELRRSNRAGYSLDLVRGFAEHARGAAHYKAQLEHGNAISRTLQQLRDYQLAIQNSPTASDKEKLLVGKIVGELHQHRQLDALPYSNNAVTQAASNVGFMYMLLSPSYWLIGLTQPALYGLPVLSARNKTGRASSRYLLQAMKAMNRPMRRRAGKAGYGFGWLTGKAVDPALFDFLETGGSFEDLSRRARLGTELADSIRGSDLNHKEQVIAMMEELGEQNLLTMGLHTDMAAAAKGGNPHGSWPMMWARVMPQIGEVFGRSSVAIAAYQMTRDSMPGVNEEEAHRKAVQAAADAVRDSMFDYSLSNRNRYMSGRQPGIGQLVKLATMFMMHAQHVYALMLRETYRMMKGQTKEERIEAFKIVSRILGGHMLAAGMIGATFEPVKIAMATLMAIANGFDDEPDEPWAVVMERTLIETFGQQVGGALAKGLPYQLLGVDLHGRLSLSNMLFYNDRLFEFTSTGRQGVANALLSAVGPLGGLAGNLGESAKSLGDGDYLRAIEQSTPKMFRDFTKAFRFSTEGMLDTSGNLTSKEAIGIWDGIVTGTGFRTAHEERVATRRSIMYNLQTNYRTQKSNALEQYKRAWNGGNPARARELRAEYNRGVPAEYQITIDDLDRMRKDKAKKEAGVRQDGVYVPKRERNLLRYVKHLE